MNIAIDVTPLESGHNVRGVGFYLNHLKNAFETDYHEHKYLFFTGQAPEKGVDIIHYPYFDPFFRTIPLRKRIPTVVTVHDLTPIVFANHFPAGIKGNLIWQFNRYLLKNVDGIITDSHSSTEDVLHLIGLSKDKVHTVYLAAGEEFKQKKISAAERKRLQDSYHLPEKFALYVGDVTWNKNLPRLLKSAIKANIPLMLIGKAISEKDYDRNHPWSKDRVKVQQLIENNRSLLYPLGFVSNEDLVSLYNLATVFVMPSLYEGFGLPVIEAMQSGCPVITSKEGSLPEVGGDAVYYIDAYSEESIVNGLQEVFNTQKLQRELSVKGIEQAKRFSWKKTAEKTITVYSSIFNNS